MRLLNTDQVYSGYCNFVAQNFYISVNIVAVKTKSQFLYEGGVIEHYMSVIKSTETNTPPRVQHSTKTKISFSVEGMLNNFMLSAFNVRVFAFFQIVKKLNPTMLSLAIFIYAGWNMVNDPLIGYLSDRNSRMQKMGRRFPLILVGSLLIGLAYLLIFLGPGQNTWLLFFWLIISTCLFDFFYSLWTTNYVSLMSVKFTAQGRKHIAVYNSIFGIVGVALGMTLPGIFLFGDYENQSAYIVSAALVGVLSLIIVLFLIPGIREEGFSQQKKNIGDKSHPSFWITLKQCLQSKNYMAHIMYTLGQGVLTTLMLGLLQYWNQFILQSDKPINETLVGAALLMGSIVAIPVWYRISKRIGTKRTMLRGVVITCTFLLLFFFFGVTLIAGIILAFMIGVSIGAMWVSMYVSFTDVITEFSLATATLSEGAWAGVRNFFNRTAFVIQALAFGIIQNVTGFDEDKSVQTPEAQLGLRVIMSLVPLIFYALGGLFIWRNYDLTPEKMEVLYSQTLNFNENEP